MGYTFQFSQEGYYNIQKKNRLQSPIKVQLVGSRPVNNIIHGSQNGNEIQAIGYYHIRLTSEQEPDFLILAFQHMENQSTEQR